MAVVIAVSFVFAGCNSGSVIKGNPKNELEKFFPTEFLADAETAYFYVEKRNFIVAPQKYVVFKFTEPPTEFLETYEFAELENDYNAENTLAYMEKLNISQKYRLNFDKSCMKANFSQGYADATGYYFAETMELIFFYRLGL